MASITLKGNAVQTSGELPSVGSTAPNSSLTGANLSDVTIDSFSGKRKVLNIFPSIDTPTCALSVKRFNEEAAKLDNTVVLNIAADLPFALKRFCGAEGIENAASFSTFRTSFATDFGLKITDGVLKGLCSRAVIVLDQKNKILYSEQVTEIADEPNYDAAIAALHT